TGVHPHRLADRKETTAAVDEVGQRRLLRAVEQRGAGVVQEDDRLVVGQVGRGESGGCRVAGGDREVVFVAEVFDRRGRGRYRRVGGAAGKEKDVRRGRRCLGAGQHQDEDGGGAQTEQGEAGEDREARGGVSADRGVINGGRPCRTC